MILNFKPLEDYFQRINGKKEWISLTEKEKDFILSHWRNPLDVLYVTEFKLKEKNQ